MKKIITFLLWDILIYFFIYLYNNISNYLRILAANKFNNNYNLLLLSLCTILFIILGLTYNLFTFQNKTGINTDNNYSISEFFIIGLNSLFISTLFIWSWFGIDAFLPNWLIADYIITNSLGGIIFGLELYRLIKWYHINSVRP